MTYAIAELLASRFTAVTLVTARERIGHDVSLINRQGIYQRLHDLGVDILCNVEPENLDTLEDAQVMVRNVYSGVTSVIEDVVMLTHASSRLPNNELQWQLEAAGIPVTAVGDCRAPRSLLATTREAYEVASYGFAYREYSPRACYRPETWYCRDAVVRFSSWNPGECMISCENASAWSR